MNYVSISGRLTRDTELKTTTSGIPVCNFTVAVRKDFGEGADFINCVAWRKTAELITKYLSKGSMALFQGRLSQSSYEFEGRTQYKTEVIVDKVEFLDSKTQDENEQSQKENESVIENGGEISLDDELPF